MKDYKDHHTEVKHQKINHYINFGQAFICSLGFLGLYVALYSSQNIQSVVFEKDGYGNLGFYSNAVTYLAQGTGSVFCVFIMEKIGDARSMAYSTLFCLPFIACLIFPALKSEDLTSTNFFLSNGFVYTVILLTSFSNGLGEGVAQPASGKFIADCATEKTKGFFFAFFWAFYMGSQVFGNLIAAFVLGELDQKYYVLIMTIIGVAASVLFFFLKAPIIQHLQHHPAATSGAKASQISTQQNMIAPHNKSLHTYTSFAGKKVTICGVIRSMWKLTCDRRFLFVVPQLAWTGVSIAYYSGNLVEMMSDAIGGDDDHYQFKMSMLAMVLFGVGEIVGCFFIGFVVDKYGSKVAVLCNLIIIILMAAFTIVFIVVYQFGWLAFAMCFFWGLQDSAVNTHAQEVLGFEFDNNAEPFSVYNILQCIACFFFQLIEAAVNERDDYLYYTIAVCIIGFFACGLPLFFPYREELANHDLLGSVLGHTKKDHDSDQDSKILEEDEVGDSKKYLLDDNSLKMKKDSVDQALGLNLTSFTKSDMNSIAKTNEKKFDDN